jgi:hypothetical protein
MAGMQSLSSANPPSCLERAAKKQGPCGDCYDLLMKRRYKNLNPAHARNSDAMVNVPLPSAALPRVNASFFRLNAGGELWNVTHAINMLRIARHNPYTNFALWTHEPKLVIEAIKKEGKPDNITLIYSSQNYNKRDKLPRFFDKTFTVFTKDFINSNDVDINCGARKCFDCLKCYDPRNKTTHINELKK